MTPDNHAKGAAGPAPGENQPGADQPGPPGTKPDGPEHSEHTGQADQPEQPTAGATPDGGPGGGEEAGPAAASGHAEEQVTEDGSAAGPAAAAGATAGPEAEQAQAAAQEDAEAANDEAAQAREEVLTLQDELARRKADLYNLQQEYSAYVRRTRAEFAMHRSAGVAQVAEVLLSVLDDIERARQHGDLEGPAGSIGEKLESSLATNIALVRFGQAGDAFDPERHEAIMSQPSDDVEVDTVFDVAQPGYMLGDKVLRAAKVAVNTPA